MRDEFTIEFFIPVTISKCWARLQVLLRTATRKLTLFNAGEMAFWPADKVLFLMQLLLSFYLFSQFLELKGLGRMSIFWKVGENAQTCFFKISKYFWRLWHCKMFWSYLELWLISDIFTRPWMVTMRPRAQVQNQYPTFLEVLMTSLRVS